MMFVLKWTNFKSFIIYDVQFNYRTYLAIAISTFFCVISLFLQIKKQNYHIRVGPTQPIGKSAPDGIKMSGTKLFKQIKI